MGILVLAPLVEEILLRGVLLSLLARRLNIYVAIVLQSLVFVVMHNPSFSEGIEAHPGILQLFGDGALFGLARHHTGSLCAPVAMHAAGNMIAVLQRIA